MKKASLFSGIGGIDLAAHWAGMETVVFCEREPYPQRVLRKHWPDVPIIDDVHDFTREELNRRGIGAIDIISGGYPCQPFSYAGKRDGTNDDRHLWPEVKRILEEIRPRWFVGENVAGHITLGLDIVLADLADIGYTAQAFVIPASSVYAVHQRKRVFIVAYSNSGKREEWMQRRVGADRTEIEARMVDRSTGYGSHSESLADSPSERCGEARDDRGRSEERTAWVGDPLAHTDGVTGLETDSPTSAIGIERNSWDDVSRSSRTCEPGYRGGAAQPGLGGGAHELSDWLDGRGLNPLEALADMIASYPQPAPRGAPQHDWEPPRVATGIKDRAPRLKALGNAVNPLQIYPIMAAIKIIDDLLRDSAPVSTESAQA